MSSAFKADYEGPGETEKPNISDSGAIGELGWSRVRAVHTPFVSWLGE